jgi:hypothetical protein
MKKQRNYNKYTHNQKQQHAPHQLEPEFVACVCYWLRLLVRHLDRRVVVEPYKIVEK